jgi:hypothetical protein
MATEGTGRTETDKHESQPLRVRLPGFIIEDQVGLGDVIKRATYAVGFKPCPGCEKRAITLNHSVVFTR